MGEINLDTARQARLEAAGERSFVFAGERFELPAELGYDVLGPIARLNENRENLGALRDVMVALLGEQAHSRFEALKPSLADLNVLIGGLFEEYGLAAGGASSNGDGDGLGPKSEPST